MAKKPMTSAQIQESRELAALMTHLKRADAALERLRERSGRDLSIRINNQTASLVDAKLDEAICDEWNRLCPAGRWDTLESEGGSAVAIFDELTHGNWLG